MQISINNNSYFAKGYNHYDTLYTNTKNLSKSLVIFLQQDN